MPSPSKSRATSRPAAAPPAVADSAIQEIDDLFQTAGLVRNLRGKAAGVTRRMRLERVTPGDLSHAAPVPAIAANGVQLLRVSAWEKAALLWHGFSTRKGGLSRSYCAEDAPGELNLGFTASGCRETVPGNRRLLVGAITGDAAPPLI